MWMVWIHLEFSSSDFGIFIPPQFTAITDKIITLADSTMVQALFDAPALFICMFLTFILCFGAQNDLLTPLRECNLDSMDVAANALLAELKKKGLNIVTVESATCGMISATLANIPFYGGYSYGGFCTYDSDAMRKFAKVEQGDVYTKEAAEEMAVGGLKNSRALTSLSITGHAGPMPKDSLTKLGVFDIAFAIRTKEKYEVYSCHMTLCHGETKGAKIVIQLFGSGDKGYTYNLKLFPSIRGLCERYLKEAEANNDGLVNPELVFSLRRELRQTATYKALIFAKSVLENDPCSADKDYINCKGLEKLPTAEYDGKYSEFGEPSWIIKNNIA